MRRRLLIAAFVAGLAGLSQPASALLSGAPGEDPWACGGVEVVAGACADNPFQVVRLFPLPLVGG